MRHFGLLGFPLSHSFSKAFFTEKFGREGIAAVYENYPLQDISGFPGLIESQPELVGLNVTIPHKQAVLNFLDALDPEAEQIGAVNTIRIETAPDGTRRLKGFNTDVIGFRESIRPFLEQLKLRLEKSGKKPETPVKALVLGTGGASKAIRFGLNQLGCEVVMVSRQAGPDAIAYEDVTGTLLEAVGILVNTTPLGMYPNVDSCPEIPYNVLSSNHLLFDAVYNPEQTLFLKKGAEQGALTVNGLEMLRLQAEAAWSIWNNSYNH